MGEGFQLRLGDLGERFDLELEHADVESVSGLVLDAFTGAALPGATVQVQGTTLGAVTNANGQYLLTNVPAGSQTLIGNLIGYQPASVPVNIPAGGLASFAFEVLPKGLLDEIDNRLADGQSTQVVAQVEVLGTLDGSDVESNLFSYPIEVCKGCLIQNLGSCESIISEEINTGGVCQALQDGILDCCTNAEGALVCPAQNLPHGCEPRLLVR